MKYRVTLSLEVDARDDREALEYAKKLEGLLKTPLARATVRSAGIQLFDEGQPIVYHPQRVG